MKKFFSLVAAVLFAGSMMADSFTITFKECATCTTSDSSTKVTTVADIIAEGDAYVSAIALADNVYNARPGRGIKLGASSKTGTLEMTLANEVNVTSIVVNARAYTTSSATESTLKIQDKTDYETTAEFADYTYTYSDATAVSSILIGTTEKRAFVTSVTVNYEAQGTGIDNTAVEAAAVKYFENGQLIIMKNGVKYNATGAVVK